MAKYTEHMEWKYGKHTEIKALIGKDIWACAYERHNGKFIRKPVKGVIIQTRESVTDNGFDNWMFYEYKKDNTLKSSCVRYNARVYADTYEECVELYNKCVEEHVDSLQRILDKTKEDFIVTNHKFKKVGVCND